jgi:peptidoglycan-N-acetylglucosamine deacetylase
MLNIFFHGNRNKNKIALTFDDGPSEETKKLLKVLKKYNAKATFFIWGERISGRENIINEMKNSGHEIGNHTYSHKRLWFKSRKFIEGDMEKCDEELKKFGIKTNLIRLPGFKFGINCLLICRKLKKKIIFSDIVSNDWRFPFIEEKKRNKFAESVVEKIISKTRNGAILNFHDYIEGGGKNNYIIEIIKKVLPKLKDKGFECVRVSDLIS